MINWDCTKEEAQTISKIVKRAMGLSDLNFMNTNMDITATHCNGNPLELEDWLKADDFNFMHDVYGIVSHIDRNTGKLRNYFLPRFSKREEN